jgi:hypothetical protein
MIELTKCQQEAIPADNDSRNGLRQRRETTTAIAVVTRRSMYFEKYGPRHLDYRAQPTRLVHANDSSRRSVKVTNHGLAHHAVRRFCTTVWTPMNPNTIEYIFRTSSSPIITHFPFHLEASLINFIPPPICPKPTPLRVRQWPLRVRIWQLKSNICLRRA